LSRKIATICRREALWLIGWLVLNDNAASDWRKPKTSDGELDAAYLQAIGDFASIQIIFVEYKDLVDRCEGMAD
jgi:hypothetical protein